MRSEKEILNLIVAVAEEDARIRAAILNGSRANPNAPRDPFQDFDIVYLVTEGAPFKHNQEWIQRFGEIMILQMPETMQDPPPAQDDTFTYLMQFTDGQRIDLTLVPLTAFDQLGTDSLSLPLLDKDGLLESLPPADESGYLPTPPSAKAFADCCNEFWWVSPYVAKGLWRGEFTYAKTFLDQVLRDQLMKMLGWHAGVRTNFSKNLGKFGKYLERYLEPEMWELLQKTYADASYKNNWEALLAMGRLFRRAAFQVAENFGFDYPHSEDEKVTAHLKHVKDLPKDAETIY